MPLNGNTFTRLYSWVNNAAQGIKIRSDLMDQDSNDIAAGISAVAALVAGVSASFATSAGASLIGFIQAGAGAAVRTLQDKSRERVTVADFGAKGDGITDDGPAIQLALSRAKTVYLDQPASNYLIASGSITVGDGQRLIGCGDSTCLVTVTANVGDNTSANALFKCVGSGSVEGLNVTYTNQCATDLVVSILVYPPTFLFNGSHVGSVKNVRVKGAYDLFRQDASDFANLTLQNIYAQVLHKGSSFIGNMGDVSTADNVQIIIYNPNTGFNGGPVDLWCRKNSTGWQFATTGGNRIDLFRFTNSGVVGGAVSFTASGVVWVAMDNWHSDIASQAFTGTWTNLVLGNGWISQMDAFYTAAHTPAINVASSKVRMTNCEISLLATGSSAPIVGDTNDITLTGVRFFTSRGYFTPVISGFGLKLNASGCSVQTSNFSGPLSFTDVNAYDMVSVTIDGIRAFSKYAGADITPANFNMATFTASVPNNWTTGLGTPANFLTQLSGGAVPGIQIFPSPAATGSFGLVYALPASITDNFGYFYVTCQVQIVDAPGTAVIGTFEWGIGNATDGYNYANLSLGNSATGAECSGLPANVFQYQGFLLVAPPNPSAALNIILTCNFPTSATQIALQIKSLQLWNVNAFYTPNAENAGGHEFLRNGSGNVRDSIVGGIRRYRRNAVIATANNTLVGDRIERMPPVIGQPKAWVATVAANPGTWVSEGVL